MKAALFRRSIPRYLAARAAWSMGPGFWSPGLAPLSLVTLTEPEPNRPGWVRLRVRLAGICGSDLHLVTGQDSLYLEPEATYPFTPGHELTGTIDAAAPGVGLPVGQRVAVWAPLGCRVRNQVSVCPSCAAGFDGLCERRDDSWPDRGLSIGFNRETGGGWADCCLAHESQLHPMPESVSDREAVLLDPAATALAALLRSETAETRSTLIIGGGTIGLLAARLVTALRRPGHCEILVRHLFQADLAAETGVPVHHVGPGGFPDWAAGHGMTSRRVPTYGHVWRGIYDRVIDTAGSPSSLAWALASTRPGGQVVLASGAANIRNFDPTPLWYREMTVRGILVYGPVPWEGRSVHPYAVLIPMLAAGSLVLSGVITHELPLSELPTALSIAAGRARSRAVKVVLRGGHPRP